MLLPEPKQQSFYSHLYDRVPKKHLLKQINEKVDLSFINEMLSDRYCKYYGRPAKEPELLVRLSILQRLYELSDENVMEETHINLAYKYFTGLNPEDELPDKSLLAKFRTQRLEENSLDEIITEIIKQCVEKGIIPQKSGISVDSTHTEANTVKKVPERIMKHLAKKIFKASKKEGYEIPNYKKIEDHNEAKQVMKKYLEEVITEASKDGRAEVKEAVVEATEVIKSPMFIEQKGIRSLVDKDARVGYKTKTESFFGYKVEYGLTTEGQLITAVNVGSGAYVDGTEFEKLYDTTKKAGIDITEVYGDGAYFKKWILDKVKDGNGIPYIPVNPSTYKIDEDLYSYNKDSDQWFCKHGNETINKKHKTTKRKDIGVYNLYEYEFSKEKCRDCPFQKECMKKTKMKSKKLQVSTNSGEYYEHSQWTKTKDFTEKYRNRARIEGKNAEQKRFHGLTRAIGYGLMSVATQAKFTAIAVNLKRIVKIC